MLTLKSVTVEIDVQMLVHILVLVVASAVPVDKISNDVNRTKENIRNGTISTSLNIQSSAQDKNVSRNDEIGRKIDLLLRNVSSHLNLKSKDDDARDDSDRDLDKASGKVDPTTYEALCYLIKVMKNNHKDERDSGAAMANLMSNPFVRSLADSQMGVILSTSDSPVTAVKNEPVLPTIKGNKSKLLQTHQAEVAVVKPDCHFVSKYHHQWIEMISNCPETFTNETLKQHCIKDEEFDESNVVDFGMLPVQDIQGVVYRNLFCALCNRALLPKPWAAKLDCDRSMPILFLDGNVLLTLMQNEVPTANCQQTLLPVYSTQVKTCRVVKRRGSHRYRLGENSPQQVSTVTYPVSFAILMNFGFDGKTNVVFSTEQKQQVIVKPCPGQNQVYDYDMNRCRAVTCPKGYTLKHQSCVPGENPAIDTSNGNSASNLQGLSDINTVAKVALEVNVTYGDECELLSQELHDFMILGISNLLNISMERIQKFNISFKNESNSLQHVRVEKIFENESMEAAADHVHVITSNDKIKHDFPDEEEPESDRLDDTDSIRKPVIIKTSSETIWDKLHKHVEYKLNIDDPITSLGRRKHRQKKLNQSETSETDSTSSELRSAHKRETNKTLSTSEETDSRGKLSRKPSMVINDTLPVCADISDERQMVMQLTFLLLPPRSQNNNEGTVDNVVSKIKEFVAQKKFTFSIKNDTVVDVVDMHDKANQVVLPPFCSRGKKMLVYGDQFSVIEKLDSSTGKMAKYLYVNATHSLYGRGYFEITVVVTGNVGAETRLQDIDGFAFVCAMPRIVNKKCGRIRISQSEYEFLPNKSISFHGKTYNFSQYEVLKEEAGDVEICVPEEYIHQNIFSDYRVVQTCGKGYYGFFKAEGYLTEILGRISIVSLALVFLTYCLLARLRNLPGVNTMNLTLALFFAEVIFILGEGTPYPETCVLVAVSLHYFFLAASFWMNVMTYDVFRTFANRCILTRVRDKRKFFWRYALYAWGSPLLIVAVCLFLDMSEVFSGVHIHYGDRSLPRNTKDQGLLDNNTLLKNGSDGENETVFLEESQLEIKQYLGCWIQNPVAALIGFGAPILIIFLINTSLFIKTILKIHATVKLANLNTRRSSVNHMTGKYDVMLYVRMSTVMGFTWVFGLASSIVSAIGIAPSNALCIALHILNILFTIFNCSQGLFIFFTFVAKKRVLFLYKGLLENLKSKILKPSAKGVCRTSSTPSEGSDTSNLSHIS